MTTEFNDQSIDYSSNPLISSPGPRISLTDSRGRLRKIGRLGGGTYGRVYQATTGDDIRDGPISHPGSLVFVLNPSIPSAYPGQMLPVSTNDKEVVAVKRNFMSPSLNESIGSLRELDMLNLVRHHPYCVKTKHVSFEQPFVDGALSPDRPDHVSDKLYFVLEKGEMDGNHYIHSNIQLTQPLVNERKLFALHTLLAVEFLHSRGVYHRDLKPANIICFYKDGKFDRAKLTDYGMAEYYSHQPLSPPGFVTLWYRAPEISLMKEYDFKSDVWSLGCILFELFSGSNQHFVKADSDDTLINLLIESLPFPKEDYLSAQQYYPKKITRSYDRMQSELKSIEKQLGCNESQISQFNSPSLGGQPNHGTFEEFIDLLQNMLTINPNRRYSISQVLNHRFFDGYREHIDYTRTRFGINSDGEWALGPSPKFVYFNSSVRQRGMKWFQFIYSHRSSTPMCNWYSHRIFFHAIEMFDRYLVLTRPPDSTLESDIVIWVNTMLFISSKNFRILVQEFGLDYYAIGIHYEEFNIFRERVQQFEEHVVRDIFKLEIYKPTIYEQATEFLTETSIVYLIKLICSDQISSGTELDSIWSMYVDTLTEVNRISSPLASANTPVVSLLRQ